MNNYVMFAVCDVSMVQIEASSDIERLSSEGIVEEAAAIWRVDLLSCTIGTVAGPR